MILYAGGKLIAYLCGHERMGDVFTLEVVVQPHEVEAEFLGNNVYTGSTRQGRIHIHHARVEPIAGVGRHPTLLRQFVVTLIPMAETHEVAVFQLAPFRHTRRA